MRTSCLIALVLASAATVAGCGRAGERDEVRDVAARFSAAVADGDGAAACRQLSGSAQAELAQQEGEPCASAVLRLGLRPGAVARVHVYMTSAAATYASGEWSFLDRDRAGWRLSAIGCRFEDGKPRSRPATCAADG